MSQGPGRPNGPGEREEGPFLFSPRAPCPRCPKRRALGSVSLALSPGWRSALSHQPCPQARALLCVPGLVPKPASPREGCLGATTNHAGQPGQRQPRAPAAALPAASCCPESLGTDTRLCGFSPRTSQSHPPAGSCSAGERDRGPWAAFPVLRDEPRGPGEQRSAAGRGLPPDVVNKVLLARGRPVLVLQPLWAAGGSCTDAAETKDDGAGHGHSLTP